MVPLRGAPDPRLLLFPARQLLAVLQLAVRAGLARRAARVVHRALRGHRAGRPLGPAEEGPPGRSGRRGDAGYPDLRAGLLSQFQVRLFHAPGAHRHRSDRDAGGARAGLLLHGVLRVLRNPGRRRVRSGGGAADGSLQDPLGRSAGPGARAGTVLRQPPDREPGPRVDRPRLRRRLAPIGGALRHPDHRRRQRHLPALVCPGSGTDPARYHPGQSLARQHRLALAADSPAGDAGVRPVPRDRLVEAARRFGRRRAGDSAGPVAQAARSGDLTHRARARQSAGDFPGPAGKRSPVRRRADRLRFAGRCFRWNERRSAGN